MEVRSLLAGTLFNVIERSDEVPDGYSFQRYVYNGNNSDAEEDVGVGGIIAADADSHVIVNNLKGWGLRVNKVWRDADYMSERDPVYFAVFTKGENEVLNLIDGTVKQIPYGAKPQTLYWYFAHLPVEGTSGVGD